MKKLITLLLATMMLFSVMFTACVKPDDGNTNQSTSSGKYEDFTVKADASGQKPVYVFTEGKEYSKQFVDGGYDIGTMTETDPIYDKDLFYKNLTWFSCADPFAFRCTDATDTKNYGKFFLFGTTTVCVMNCFMSEDLVSWVNYSGAYTWDANGWQSADCWAPEIIWDEFANPSDYGLEDDGIGKGVYFMFSSASPWYEIEKESNDEYEMVLDLAVSVSPSGPYYVWTGVEKGATVNNVNYGEEANFAKYTNYVDAYEEGTYNDFIGRQDNQVTIDDTWFNSPAAQASLQYQWENRENAGEVDPATGLVINPYASQFVVDEGYSWMSSLDPTPFYDYNEMVTKTDGTKTWQEPKKYLFFTRERPTHTKDMILGTDNELAFPGTCVYCVTFVDNDWAQIDYNSLTRVTRDRFNFVSQGSADIYNEQAENFNASAYEKGYKETTTWNFKKADAELYLKSDSYINEGSQVVYNKETGLYYLTLSVGVYYNETYSVIQAVAYSPMGPYRKLDMSEGGITLSTNHGKSVDNVTGPGHHTMIQVGDELLMVYHKHLDLSVSIHSRGPALDRVIWVENNDGMTVMHVNGPSTYLQPIVYGTGATEYDIISDEARVTVSGDQTKFNNAKYLNDGIIPMHTKEVSPFVHEFEYSERKVITFTFDDYRQIPAFMIYNSKEYDNTFFTVPLVEMDVIKDGVECTVQIKNMQFNWDETTFKLGGSMRPGGCAVAAFNELSIKEIRITMENEGYYGFTAISEVYILGRPVNA